MPEAARPAFHLDSRVVAKAPAMPMARPAAVSVNVWRMMPASTVKRVAPSASRSPNSGTRLDTVYDTTP